MSRAHLAFVTAVIGAAVAAAPAAGTSPGRNGEIVVPFMDNFDTGSATGARPTPFRYGLIGVTGGQPARAVVHCAFEPPSPPCSAFESPDWSPDGLTLAVASDSGVDVMSADGSGRRTVAEYGHSPAWSPDGRRIAFIRAGDVFIVRADGSGLRRVTRRATEWFTAVHALDWSAGNRLAVAADGLARSYVFTVSPDGGGARVVARAPSQGTIDWAPDGRRLLMSGGGPLIVVDVRRRRAQTVAPSGYGARWSPDGRSIAYFGLPPVSDALTVARADGTRPRTYSLVEQASGYRPDSDYRDYGAPAWQPRP